jgi:hypothetical protein
MWRALVSHRFGQLRAFVLAARLHVKHRGRGGSGGHGVLVILSARLDTERRRRWATGQRGTPMGGMPMGEMPMGGMPMGGMPMGEMPMGGMPMSGTPMAHMRQRYASPRPPRPRSFLRTEAPGTRRNPGPGNAPGNTKPMAERRGRDAARRRWRSMALLRRPTVSPSPSAVGARANRYRADTRRRPSARAPRRTGGRRSAGRSAIRSDRNRKEY